MVCAPSGAPGYAGWALADTRDRGAGRAAGRRALLDENFVTPTTNFG
jgi:hypothetical protein